MAQVNLGLAAGQIDKGNPNFSPAVSFFRALRAIVKNTLSEILTIPEALTNVQIGLELAFPYLIILGRNTRPIDMAVNDAVQVITVDFLYVAANAGDGVTDSAQAARDRLVVLQNAILANYRLGGACNQAVLVETPVERTNQYQQFFADQGQQLTVMILSMDFTVIQALGY